MADSPNASPASTSPPSASSLEDRFSRISPTGNGSTGNGSPGNGSPGNGSLAAVRYFPALRPGQPLTTFAIVWSTATLIHLLSFHFWARTWQGWLLVLCVGLTVMRPGSVLRFSALILASLNNLANKLPFVPNHILFEGIVNLTILLAIVWGSWRHRSEVIRACRQNRATWKVVLVSSVLLGAYLLLLQQFKNEHVGGTLTALLLLFFSCRPPGECANDALPAAIQQNFAGVLRWELAVMYYWAVIQKLNVDYFNPAVSCAVKMQRELETLLQLPASPERLLPVFSIGSLLIEAAIPLLLFIKLTRITGFLLTLVFHAWLALHPFPGIYSFSALVLAMLVLFLPEPARNALHCGWKRQRQFLVRVFKLPSDPQFPGGLAMTVFYVLGISSALLYSSLGENRATFHRVNTLGLIAFLVWGSWLGGSYLYAWRSRTKEKSQSLSVLRLSPAWIGVVLVIFNGLNPWLGLKTQTSFAMFSNLRTEFAPNHLFLQRIDLFPYQQEMIEVLDSTPNLLAAPDHPTGIEQFANPGRIMPLFELRRLLSRGTHDIVVRIRQQDGSIKTIFRHAGRTNDAAAFQAPSLWERKLLWFRRHDSWAGPMFCTH